MPSTVLSHLAFKLAPHPENLATEALGYILSSSSGAQSALATLVKQFGFVPSSNLSYVTQQSTHDGKRPDLVGSTLAGIAEIVIEAKFWAGLTDAQPVHYLKRLPDTGGILLFVVPEQRIETIWSELLRRCINDGMQCDAENDVGQDRYIRLGQKYLALISWRRLLTHIAVALNAASDLLHAADVQQLLGLSEAMDSQAFLPLNSEELTGTLGNRLIQFVELTNDLVTRLVNQGFKTKGAAQGSVWYGRNLKSSRYEVFIGFSANLWRDYGHSPIWLGLEGIGGTPVPDLVQILESNGIYAKYSEKRVNIPIYLRTGMEREPLLSDCQDQLKRIVHVL